MDEIGVWTFTGIYKGEKPLNGIFVDGIPDKAGQPIDIVTEGWTFFSPKDTYISLGNKETIGRQTIVGEGRIRVKEKIRRSDSGISLGT